MSQFRNNLHSVWTRCDETVQYVHQIFNPTGTELFKVVPKVSELSKLDNSLCVFVVETSSYYRYQSGAWVTIDTPVYSSTVSRECVLSQPVLPGKNTLIIEVNGQRLLQSEYTTTLNSNGYIVSFKIVDAFDLTKSDIVFVKTYSNTTTPDSTGLYSVPMNLLNNPNNEDVDYIDAGNFTQHFSDVVGSVITTGLVDDVNNYERFFELDDKGQYKSSDIAGKQILQHESSLLPLMITTANQNLDIVNSVMFVEHEYVRFKNRFINKLLNGYRSGSYKSKTTDYVVDDILTSINVGKSSDFPFAINGVGSTDTIAKTYIPPTPQFLGILPPTKPSVGVYMHVGSSFGKYNIDHTGAVSRSYTDALGDSIVDDAILNLETRIYNSINKKFKVVGYKPLLSMDDIVAEYTSTEWKTLMSRGFVNWTAINDVDYSSTNYDVTDWKTWNYTGCKYTEDDTYTFNGSWISVYIDIYGTWRPHTHPWECVGITVKPTWWDTTFTPTKLQVGAGTNEYVLVYADQTLWDSLSGTDPVVNGFKTTPFVTRTNKIPVKWTNTGKKTSTGTNIVTVELKSPLELGVITGVLPAVQDPWLPGDIGAVEFAYMNSPLYSYDLALGLFRAKPAKFSTYFFDTTSYGYKNGQYIYGNGRNRLIIDENVIVHGENGTSVLGYQQWISDYLLHQNKNITTNFGDIVRGSAIKVGTRLGGYTTAGNITFTSDSFGLVPNESQTLGLAKSSVIKEEIYSALTITYTGTGYSINGFDLVSPVIHCLTPVKNGKKYTIDITDDYSLTRHGEYDTTIYTVKYNQIIPRIQEVFNIICAYGEYLESRGWVFEDQDTSMKTLNWNYVAELFASWAYSKPTRGDFITISPSTASIKYKSEFGAVQSITQFSGGVWSILDENGDGIRPGEIDTARIGSTFSVRVNDNIDKKIMLLRLNVASYEHAVVFENSTIFGDNIYIPKYGAKHEMLKMYGNLTTGWNGRLEANGFIVLETGTIPNFEKLVNDFSSYYSDENIGNTEIENLSKHVIGFQTRDYLRQLIVDERSQLDFYRGFIREKGTRQAFGKVLRASKTYKTENYKALEEWAFKVGEYGNVDGKQHLQVQLLNDQLKQNPQLLVRDSNATADTADKYVTFYGTGVDSRIMNDPKYSFPMTTPNNKFPLPDIGPVVLDQVDVYGTNYDVVDSNRKLYTTVHGVLPSTAWVFADYNDTWDVVRITDTGKKLTGLTVVSAEQFAVDMVFSSNLGLNDGDLFFIYSSSGVVPERLTDHIVYNSMLATGNKYRISLKQTTTVSFTDAKVYVYRSVFNASTKQQYINAVIPALVPDTRKFDLPFIYNGSTYTTEYTLTKYDPSNGVFAGQILSDIDFSTVNDPALYNAFDLGAVSWGKDQVGKTWWDTSTMYYVNSNCNVLVDPFNGNYTVDTAKTIEYKRTELGKILEGTEINVYEWVKSPVPPYDWDDYVSSFKTQNKKSSDFTPSGTANQQNWVVSDEYDTTTKEYKKVYYFWVKDIVSTPDTNRNRSVAELSRLISNPLEIGSPWFAPINANSFIINGIADLITDDKFILDISYSINDVEQSKHIQWQLCKEGLDYNINPYLWKSMFNSLCADEVLDTGSPKPLIYPVNTLGNGPTQTWFKDVIEARRIFTDASNNIFRTLNITADTKLMDEVFNVTTKKINPAAIEFSIGLENNEMVVIPTNKTKFNENDVVVVYSTGSLPNPLAETSLYYVHITPAKNIQLMKNVSIGGSGNYIQLDSKGSGIHTIILQKDFVLNLENDLVMTNYWHLADWYAVGFSESTAYTNEVDTTSIDTSEYEQGDVIRVIGEDNRWTLYQYIDSNGVMVWDAVGREKSTIELNEMLYSGYEMFDTDGTKTDRERNIRTVIRLLMSAFTNVQSRLLFDMVKFVHSEQLVIDWVFKTSYIFIVGLEQPLRLVYEQRVDLLDQIVKYFEEVKPYSTKIRSQIEQKTSDEDHVNGYYNDNGPLAYDAAGNKIQPDIWDLKYATYNEKDEEWEATGTLPSGFVYPDRPFQSSTEVLHFDNVSDITVESTDKYRLVNSNSSYTSLVQDGSYYLSNKYKFIKPVFGQEIILEGITQAKLGNYYPDVRDYDTLFHAITAKLNEFKNDIAASELFISRLDTSYTESTTEIDKIQALIDYSDYNTLANRLRVFNTENTNENIRRQINYHFKGINIIDNIGTKRPHGYSSLGTSKVYGYKMISTSLYTDIYNRCAAVTADETALYKHMMYEYGVYPWFVDADAGELAEIALETAIVYGWFNQHDESMGYDEAIELIESDYDMHSAMVMIPRKYIKLVDADKNVIEVPESQYINNVLESHFNNGGYLEADIDSLSEVELDANNPLYQDYMSVLTNLTTVGGDRSGYDADGYEAGTKRITVNAIASNTNGLDVADISSIKSINGGNGKITVSCIGYKGVYSTGTLDNPSYLGMPITTGKAITNPYNGSEVIMFAPDASEFINQGTFNDYTIKISARVLRMYSTGSGVGFEMDSDTSKFARVGDKIFLVTYGNGQPVFGGMKLNESIKTGNYPSTYEVSWINPSYNVVVVDGLTLSADSANDSICVMYVVRNFSSMDINDDAEYQIDIMDYDAYYDTIYTGSTPGSIVDATFVCQEYGYDLDNKPVGHGLYMPDYAKGALSELTRTKLNDHVDITEIEYNSSDITQADRDANSVYVDTPAMVRKIYTDYRGGMYLQNDLDQVTIQINNGVITSPLYDNGTNMVINGSYCTVYNNRLLSGGNYSTTLAPTLTGTFVGFIIPSDWTSAKLSMINDEVGIHQMKSTINDYKVIKKE